MLWQVLALAAQNPEIATHLGHRGGALAVEARRIGGDARFIATHIKDDMEWGAKATGRVLMAPVLATKRGMSGALSQQADRVPRSFTEPRTPRRLA